MSEATERNARINSFDIALDRGHLTCWLYLEWGSGGQGFGGYSLDCAGSHGRPGPTIRFLTRILETLGAERFSDLPGMVIRIRHESAKVHAIGHPIEDRWFCPDDDDSWREVRPTQ